ncbi:hypothetical protein ARMSODRAFT_953358 [Armillaria solidipes]|uniref:Uncharacterized protein n=1 Tax=Armillaria solidipes TaxID=1076256 RepID=A0A2H3BPY7_9AGAR|nr:hypothetical protein ARMSODRAFT_953358 [Armillaria solidipes]
MFADNVIICFVFFLIQLFFVSRIYFRESLSMSREVFVTKISILPVRPNGRWILGALVLCSIGTFGEYNVSVYFCSTLIELIFEAAGIGKSMEGHVSCN